MHSLGDGPFVSGWRRAVVVVASILWLVTLPSAQADPPLSEEDGRALQGKIARIVSNSQTNRTDVPEVVLWEREINAYLRFQAVPLLPAGVTEPLVTLQDAGRVATSARVDLEAISSSRPRGALDPLRYLRGVVPVAAEGRLDAREDGGGSRSSPRRSAGSPFRSPCCARSSATTRGPTSIRRAST